MRDYNKVIILGRVAGDPDSRVTPNGQPVCSFRVATNRRWKDSAGNLQEETEFHQVVAWGKLAETAGQILYKGRQVFVEGRLRTRNWEGQDGVRRYTTEIIAENISALGAPQEAPTPAEEPAVQETETPEEEVSIEEVSKEIEKEQKKKKGDKTKKSKADKKKRTKKEKTEEAEEITDDMIDDLPF